MEPATDYRYMMQVFKILATDTLEKLNAVEADLSGVPYDASPNHPTFIILKQLLESDLTRQPLLELGTLSGTHNGILIALLRELDPTIAMAIWKTLTLRHKVELLMPYEDARISETWPPDKPLTRALLLSDKETATYAFEYALERDDMEIAAMILDFANPTWIDTDDADEDHYCPSLVIDKAFIRARAAYRLRAAKSAVLPLLLAQRPDSGANPALIAAVSDCGLMAELVRIMAL